MKKLKIIPVEEFNRVRNLSIDKYKKLLLFSDMCRANTLMAVKKAGSGHLGSSFSAIDIFSWLFTQEMNFELLGTNDVDRDIFFSSKGHDVPSQYAVLYALGVIKEEQLLKLRRFEGLDGHPEKYIVGMEASTGSLGMGISKAKGMSWAKKLQNHKGKVFVMTGDGELQEGQIWESLQTAAHQNSDITVIVDHNKIQTDMPVSEIINLRDLEVKFKAFGWHVERCNGHDFSQIETKFKIFKDVHNQPKILIADTIKGCGVSFMETIAEMGSSEGKYLWHSGAPNDEHYQAGYKELLKRITNQCKELGISSPIPVEIPKEEKLQLNKVTKDYVSQAYGDELLQLASSHPEIVILDGDLAADCKIRPFDEKYC